MTTYTTPDYLAELQITKHEFELLSGIAFSIKLFRPDRCNPVGCMIIIPQLQKISNDNTAEAWVWPGSKRSIIPCNCKVFFEFVEPIEQTLNESKKLNMKLSGKLKEYIPNHAINRTEDTAAT